MMYLSSYRLGGNPDILRKPDDRGRAGIILNALDVFGDTRGMHIDREIGDLKGLGYRAEEVDLRSFFADRTGLEERLSSLDLLWVVGGNSFALARAMTATGFRDVLVPALARGLVYAGYSAGACVTGPDLDGIDLIDDPEDIPAGYDSTVPPTTLGLLPVRIVPHWRSDHPESERADAAVTYLERMKRPYRALRDGEALVVHDNGAIEVVS